MFVYEKDNSLIKLNLVSCVERHDIRELYPNFNGNKPFEIRFLLGDKYLFWNFATQEQRNSIYQEILKLIEFKEVNAES
tara:strand:+ start:207 stop:443 length:237 start_codon:yes stop_codon:yes gene_type:complete